MASQFPRRQRDLIAALQNFIQNVDKLDKNQVTKTLEEFSAELSQLTDANNSPQTHIQLAAPPSNDDTESPIRAAMHYPSPQALTRELPALLDLRGIVLVTNQRPPLMNWLNLHITCETKTDSVQLVARVVQHTPSGIALEIETVSPQVREQLVQLAKSTSTPITAIYTCPTNNNSPQTCKKFLESEGEPLNRYNLEQTDLETILLEISHRRGFGLLQIQHAAHTWQIVHLHHQIADIQHFPLRDAESLTALLLESKNISREQYDNVQNYAQTHDTEPESALVALGYLSEIQLAQAHKARIMLLLQRLLQRTTGQVAYFGLTYPPTIQNLVAFHKLALASIPARVFNHVHARYQNFDHSHLLVAAQRFQNHTLTLNESLHTPLNALALDEPLKNIALSLKTSPEHLPQTLPQLIEASSLPPSKTLALCLALERIGLIKLNAQNHPCEPPCSQPTEDQNTPEDHFSRLGLHWSTYDQEIQRVYHQLHHQYQTSNLHEDPQHVRVFAAITQAYEEIRSPTRRTRYRNSLIDPYTLENALREFRQKAENAKLNRDIDAAIDACCRIIELDPDDPNAREDLKTLRPLKLWSNTQQPDQTL